MTVSRTIATAAATAIASTGLIGLTAGSAAADTTTCVTRAEFGNVKRGFTKTRVHRIFDVSGRQTSWSSGFGTTYESREYRPCTGRYSYVSVSYKNGKVYYKSAYWS